MTIQARRIKQAVEKPLPTAAIKPSFKLSIGLSDQMASYACKLRKGVKGYRKLSFEQSWAFKKDIVKRKHKFRNQNFLV